MATHGALVPEVAACELSRRTTSFRPGQRVFGVLNPLPFDPLVAALIFHILHVRTAVVLWNKGAAWPIVFGLLLAVIPRFVNLAQV